MNTVNDKKQRLNLLFSSLAENYEKFAFIQQEVGKRMLSRLDYIKFSPTSIIDAGCATGYHCRLLAKKFPKAKIKGLDISTGMITAANKKRSFFSKQKFIQVDMTQTDLSDNSVDFIFSNLTLPWINDIQLCIKEWQRILKPDGLLLFSTFGPDSLIELKQAIKESSDDVKMLNFIDMHDIGDSLLQNKFAEPVMDVENISLLFDDMKSLLDELSATGVLQLLLNNKYSQLSHNRFIMEKIDRIDANYPGYIENNDKVYPLNYEIIYGHAWGTDLTKQSVQGAKMANEETFILDTFLDKN